MNGMEKRFSGRAPRLWLEKERERERERGRGRKREKERERERQREKDREHREHGIQNTHCTTYKSNTHTHRQRAESKGASQSPSRGTKNSYLVIG